MSLDLVAIESRLRAALDAAKAAGWTIVRGTTLLTSERKCCAIAAFNLTLLDLLQAELDDDSRDNAGDLDHGLLEVGFEALPLPLGAKLAAEYVGAL